MKSVWTLVAFLLCITFATLVQGAPKPWFDFDLSSSGRPIKKGSESSYIRFGKRSYLDSDASAKRSPESSYIRFGKRSSDSDCLKNLLTLARNEEELLYLMSKFNCH